MHFIEANNRAFAAQDERTALLQKITELEKEVAGFKAWEAERSATNCKMSDSVRLLIP